MLLCRATPVPSSAKLSQAQPTRPNSQKVLPAGRIELHHLAQGHRARATIAPRRLYLISTAMRQTSCSSADQFQIAMAK